MTVNIVVEQSYKNAVIEFIEVHISEIKAGDTIIHYGELKTVCRNNIKHDRFMGISLFGDTYKSGYNLVKKVIILKF